MSDSCLTVVFHRWSELAAQGVHLTQGCLFVPLPSPIPEPFSQLTIILCSPDGQQLQLKATVVQIAPDVGMALQLQNTDECMPLLQPLLTSGKPDDEDAATTEATWGQARPTATESEPEQNEQHASIHERIRSLSTNEKLKLAQTGDRGERLVLLKDTNKTVHLFLLKNRGITVDEIRFMAAYRQTNPEALKLIAENREWMQHPRVLSALVSNPKTPGTTAKSLLTRLPKTELRRLAKSQSVPRLISQAARKLVIT